jgi:flagellar basal body P-ring formation protein FlgA
MKKGQCFDWFLISLWLSPLLVSVAFCQHAVPAEGLWTGQTIGFEEMSKMLENHLQKMIQDPNKKVEIRDFRGYEKITLPRKNLSCRIFLPEQAVRGGSIAGTMVFYANGQEVKRIRISAWVDIYGDVVVVKHYLKRQQAIQEDDVQVVRKNFSLLPQDVVTDVKEVLGKRTTLAVNNLEVLRLNMLEVPPLVKKGDRVIILFENDLFKITALGEVKEGGRKGDKVKLVNLSSKKEVCGRVMDANTVQVDF